MTKGLHLQSASQQFSWPEGSSLKSWRRRLASTNHKCLPAQLCQQDEISSTFTCSIRSGCSALGHPACHTLPLQCSTLRHTCSLQCGQKGTIICVYTCSSDIERPHASRKEAQTLMGPIGKASPVCPLTERTCKSTHMLLWTMSTKKRTMTGLQPTGCLGAKSN